MMWTNRDIFEDFYYITSLHATCIETSLQCNIRSILVADIFFPNGKGKELKLGGGENPVRSNPLYHPCYRNIRWFVYR